MFCLFCFFLEGGGGGGGVERAFWVFFFENLKDLVPRMLHMQFDKPSSFQEETVHILHYWTDCPF